MTKFFIAILFFAFSALNAANATDFMCGVDLNLDGYLGDEGEVKSCIGSGTNRYCPIQSALCKNTAVSKPTVGTLCALTFYSSWGTKLPTAGTIISSGKCQMTGGGHAYTCPSPRVPSGLTDSMTEVSCEVYIPPPPPPYAEKLCVVDGDISRATGYYEGKGCSSDGKSFFYPTTCPSKWKDFSGDREFVCELIDNPEPPPEYSGTPECPLGKQYACGLDSSNGNYYCSPNDCSQESVEEVVEIDKDMLVDNGEKDDEGACLDQVLIFNGRAETCKKPGVESAFQNCCKDVGKVTSDSTGNIASVSAGINGAMSVISATYSAIEAGVLVYNAGVAAGMTSAAAASTAGTAMQSTMMVGFDPTTIAISVAIMVITEYMQNACKPEEAQTVIANSSGQCVELGTYCSKKMKFAGCVQKSKSFCCFNSKMARIIHEQGRVQLNSFDLDKPFGDVKEPDCRGFSPEEFQALDFSKIDLSEYYEDLNHSTQEKMNEDINNVTQDYLKNVSL